MAPSESSPTSIVLAKPARETAYPGSRLGRAAGLLAERGDDVGPALLVALQGDDLALLGVLQKLREGRIPVVGLIEGRVLPDHGLLDHRAPQGLLVLPHERLDGVDELSHGLGLLLGQAPQQARLLGVPD